MCDCIEKINTKLKEEYGIAGMDQTCTTHDGKISLGAIFRPRTKDGRIYRHSRYLGIYPPFCPFCGKPYKEGVTRTVIRNPYTNTITETNTTKD